MSSNPLWTATFRVGEADLEYMTLEATDLPDDLRGYQLARSGPLDNAEMAENGFQGSTADQVSQRGPHWRFPARVRANVRCVSHQRSELRRSNGRTPV